jgi:hypothetical protein
MDHKCMYHKNICLGDTFWFDQKLLQFSGKQDNPALYRLFDFPHLGGKYPVICPNDCLIINGYLQAVFGDILVMRLICLIGSNGLVWFIGNRSQ